MEVSSAASCHMIQMCESHVKCSTHLLRPHTTAFLVRKTAIYFFGRKRHKQPALQ